jgi:small GTP-binding protein
MINRKFDRSLKIVVIGESGVGKSCFLLRFVKDTFEEQHPSTLGIEFLSKVVQTENQRVQLQLWDTAGQELFRSVTRGYYRGSSGALVIFDLTNRESFEKIDRWIQDVRSLARPDVILVLLGNKSDLDTQCRVRTEEADAYAKENGIKFFEVSAKTGANVGAAVDYLVQQIEKSLGEATGQSQARIVNPRQDAQDGDRKCC